MSDKLTKKMMEQRRLNCVAEGEAFSLNPWEKKRCDVNTQFFFLPISGDDTPPRLRYGGICREKKNKLHSEATATPAILNLCVGVFSFTVNFSFSFTTLWHIASTTERVDEVCPTRIAATTTPKMPQNFMSSLLLAPFALRV